MHYLSLSLCFTLYFFPKFNPNCKKANSNRIIFPVPFSPTNLFDQILADWHHQLRYWDFGYKCKYVDPPVVDLTV